MMASQQDKHTWRIRTSPALQQRAKELRQEMTLAEAALWERLRGRRLNGLKFRRQHPLGPFIADFYCAAHRLVVEISGGVHQTQAERDQARTTRFEEFGYRVIRFSNEQVEQSIEAVLAEIVKACA